MKNRLAILYFAWMPGLFYRWDFFIRDTPFDGVDGMN